MQIIDILHRGGIVIYPTETLYGLGASPYHREAFARLQQLKGRDEAKPIPFLVRDVGMAENLVDHVPPVARDLMTRFWPGPLTIVFRAKGGIPESLCGPRGTIGLRVSAHPVAQTIVKNLGSALTATSANASGGGNLLTFNALREEFDGRVDLIIWGGVPAGEGSTVVDVSETPAKIVRRGIITTLNLGGN
jgi:L-threonylcarbamoyladenylate synthase